MTTRMKTYAEKLRDPRWQKKRNRILERDNYTCQDTGRTDETLHVHHCHYFKGDPWDTPDEYLITLCESAHKQRQIIEGEIKKCLGLAFAQSVELFDDSLFRINGIQSVIQSFLDGIPSFDYACCAGEMAGNIKDEYGRGIYLDFLLSGVLSFIRDNGAPESIKCGGHRSALSNAMGLKTLLDADPLLKESLMQLMNEESKKLEE